MGFNMPALNIETLKHDEQFIFHRMTSDFNNVF